MDKQRGKRSVVLIIVLMILVGGGFLSYKMITREESKQKFRVVNVERGEISSTVTATGMINPVIMVSVGSQVSGTIKALSADFNSPVREGQLIAQIDPAILQSWVDQANGKCRIKEWSWGDRLERRGLSRLLHVFRDNL
jgi:HlyD family secretion protein